MNIEPNKEAKGLFSYSKKNSHLIESWVKYKPYGVRIGNSFININL